MPAVVLEYLKVLALPTVVTAIVLYVLIRYRAVITTVVQMLMDNAAARDLIDAGVTLTLTGTQFRRVAELYDQLTIEKLISVDEHRKWAIFVTHFKKAYPQALDAWRAARQTKGSPTSAKARRRVAQEFDALSLTLAKFELEAYERLAKLNDKPPS